MTRLQDKVAVITGGGRGLGETVARRFAVEGARVVVADIDEARAAEVAGSIQSEGGVATSVVGDVGTSAGAQGIVAAAVDAFGSLDVLVNNAATFGAGVRVVDIDEDAWDLTMRINLKGPFLCSKYAVAQMRDQGSGGSIVFVSSVSGVVANENQADYNASKHGVIGLARCIALDCRDWHVRANVVAPTGMHGTAMMAHTPPENVAPYAAQTAFHRLAETSEVSNAVLFMASDEASFITGAVLMVDGGATAFQPSGPQLKEGEAAFLREARQKGSAESP